MFLFINGGALVLVMNLVMVVVKFGESQEHVGRWHSACSAFVFWYKDCLQINIPHRHTLVVCIYNYIYIYIMHACLSSDKKVRTSHKQAKLWWRIWPHLAKFWNAFFGIRCCCDIAGELTSQIHRWHAIIVLKLLRVTLLVKIWEGLGWVIFINPERYFDR